MERKERKCFIHKLDLLQPCTYYINRVTAGPSLAKFHRFRELYSRRGLYRGLTIPGSVQGKPLP